MLYNFNFKKRWGQNFLVDQNIVRKIIESADVSANDNILEIGPGDGFLTKFLLEKSKTVTAIEIDKKLFAFLTDKFKNFPSLNLIQADALKYDWNAMSGVINKVVANIPYQITSPLIFKCINELPNCERYVFMIQKEVADRLAAGPDSKEYGAFSVVVQSVWDIKKCFNVSRNVFNPKPKVDSAVICAGPKKDMLIAQSEITGFGNMMKFVFSKRRKVLLNVLAKEYNINREVLQVFWKERSLLLTCRAENVPVKTWNILFNLIKKAVKAKRKC
ncbi:MAG: 16S rRNA (adenine(1518)-N(6)/adenine(1519)-N(6))-dimethyltransferase RsmA [Elusimicrobiota bacterium]